MVKEKSFHPVTCGSRFLLQQENAGSSSLVMNFSMRTSFTHSFSYLVFSSFQKGENFFLSKFQASMVSSAIQKTTRQYVS